MHELPGCRPAGAILIAFCVLSGCAPESIRRLDPEYADEEYRATMKFRFEHGVTPAAVLAQFEPGDIIAFSASEDSGGTFKVLGMAISKISHVAVVIPYSKRKLSYGMASKGTSGFLQHLRVLSADSEQGVFIDLIENCVKGRDFYVFAFPPGLLVPEKLVLFAERAVFLGRLDYDWSAAFGMPTNLTPNDLREVGDEYTCATAVAAALHFSGLSLDQAWRGVVTPGNIIYSIARRNLNGPHPVPPDAPAEPESGAGDPGGSD